MTTKPVRHPTGRFAVLMGPKLADRDLPSWLPLQCRISSWRFPWPPRLYGVSASYTGRHKHRRCLRAHGGAMSRKCEGWFRMRRPATHKNKTDIMFMDTEHLPSELEISPWRDILLSLFLSFVIYVSNVWLFRRSLGLTVNVKEWKRWWDMRKDRWRWFGSWFFRVIFRKFLQSRRKKEKRLPYLESEVLFHILNLTFEIIPLLSPPPNFFSYSFSTRFRPSSVGFMFCDFGYINSQPNTRIPTVAWHWITTDQQWQIVATLP